MTREKRKRSEIPNDSVFHEAHTKKTQPIKRVRRGFPWGCLPSLFLSVALVIGVLIVLLQPTLFNLYTPEDMTATAQSIRQTENALATNIMSNAETHIALEIWQGDLARDATQSALNDSATQTAISVANAQQATRAAFDFAATQTQVDLDYLGTQAALDQEATAIALGITPDRSLPHVVETPTPAPSPLAMENVIFEDDFTEGLSGGLWQYSIDDWTVAGGVLTATDGGAELMTQTNVLTDYALEIDLITIGTGAEYFILLNLPQGGLYPGLALRLVHNGARLTEAGLYQSQAALATEDWLGLSELTAIASMQVDSTPTDTLNIQVVVRDERVVVIVNAQQVLDVSLSASLFSGAIGLQVPFGTGIERIALYR